MERLTVKEAAILLGASDQWVRMKCAAGELGEQYGKGRHRKHYMISPAGIMRWNGWSEDRCFAEIKKLKERSNEKEAQE